MAKKLNVFIKELLQKAGVQVDADPIKSQLEQPEMSALEISDELSAGIENGLIGLHSAKNNHPDIKNHYYALAYNGLDAELNAAIDELELPEEAKTDLKNERSSTKRAKLLAFKVKELEAAKRNAGSEATKQLNQQITELNNQIRTIKDNEKKIVEGFQKQLKDKDMSYNLRNLMSKYQTIYDELSPGIKDTTLRAVINEELSSLGAELTIDDTTGTIILRKKDGSNVFTDDNRQMTPDVFLDKTFAKHKILKVNDSGNNGNNNQNNQNSNNNSFNNNRNGQFQNNNSGNNGNQNGNNYNNNGNGNQNNGNRSNTLAELAKQSLDDLNKSSTNPLGM